MMFSRSMRSFSFRASLLGPSLGSVVTACLLTACGDGGAAKSSPTRVANVAAGDVAAGDVARDVAGDVSAADVERMAAEIVEAGGKVERSKGGSSQGTPAAAGLVGITLSKTMATDADVAGWIARSPLLETLDLSGCGAAGPQTWAAVARSARLRRLRLNDTTLDDASLALMSGLEQLEQCELQRCPQLTVAGVEKLGTWPRLRDVKLGGAGMGNDVVAALARCSGLRVVGLDDTAVTDVAALAPLKNLQRLSLVRAAVTDEGLESLGKLPELRHLRLRGTKITDRGLAAVARCQRLATLDLSETVVGDDGVAQLATLAELEDVNFWKTRIGDAGLAHALGWKRLRRLNLDDDVALTDAGLVPLAQLADLEFLHLGNTQLTDDGLRAFSRVKGLRELIVTECPKVTAAGIRELRAALPEATIRE